MMTFKITESNESGVMKNITAGVSRFLFVVLCFLTITTGVQAKNEAGKVVDRQGNVITENITIKAENATITADENDRTQDEIEFVDFISGGTTKDGIVSVTKVRKE